MYMNIDNSEYKMPHFPKKSLKNSFYPQFDNIQLFSIIDEIDLFFIIRDL